MIVPVLQGGLGNQMFQISNAFAYAKRFNLPFGINYNLSYCPNQGHKAEKYRNNFYKNIPSTDVSPHNAYFETQFKYNPIPKFDSALLYGYFQTEKYFEDFREDVKNLFEFPIEVKSKVDEFINSLEKPIVGIHIRRGDYIRFQNHHGLQKSDYYAESAKIFTNHSSVVCTDDWNSLNKEMAFSKSIKSPFNEELEDLYLLSQCDSLIICNSSFSWWGAYLGKQKEKVIAPKNWFGNDGPKDYQDIYQKDWICL